MELKIKEKIKKGEIETASKLIFDLIVVHAQKKDIAKATDWREKLISLDSTQLALIFDSAEIIKSERAALIDPIHKTLWKGLYDSFTEKEGHLLYRKMQQREFPANKILIQQGKLNNTLFFVDEGQIKITFRQGTKEVFFNNLENGDTAGQDTFFNISICTNTVVTVKATKLRYLSRTALQELESDIPGISKKLAETCAWLESKSPNVNQNRPTHERRQHERHKVSAKITVQTFDKNGEPVRPMYQGWLGDISIGGAAIIIDYADKSIGRSLLGRMTSLSIRFNKGSGMDLKGRILGAKHDDSHAYTINMKFSNPVDPSLLQNILARNSNAPLTHL